MRQVFEESGPEPIVVTSTFHTDHDGLIVVDVETRVHGYETIAGYAWRERWRWSYGAGVWACHVEFDPRMP